MLTTTAITTAAKTATAQYVSRTVTASALAALSAQKERTRRRRSKGCRDSLTGAPSRGVKRGLPPGRAGGPAIYFVQDFTSTRRRPTRLRPPLWPGWTLKEPPHSTGAGHTRAWLPEAAPL